MGGAGAAPYAYLAISVSDEEVVVGEGEGTDVTNGLVGLEVGKLEEVKSLQM